MAQSMSFTSTHYSVELNRTNETKPRYILTLTASPLRSKKRPVFHFKHAVIDENDIYKILWRLTVILDDTEFDGLVGCVTARLVQDGFGAPHINLPTQDKPHVN